MAKRMAIGTRPEQWPGDASPIVRGMTTNARKTSATILNEAIPTFIRIGRAIRWPILGRANEAIATACQGTRPHETRPGARIPIPRVKCRFRPRWTACLVARLLPRMQIYRRALCSFDSDRRIWHIAWGSLRLHDLIHELQRLLFALRRVASSRQSRPTHLRACWLRSG